MRACHPYHPVQVKMRNCPCFRHQPHKADTYWVSPVGLDQGGRKIAGSMEFGSCSLQDGTGRENGCVVLIPGLCT